MASVDLTRDFMMTTATGDIITVTSTGMTIITPESYPMEFITITGTDYDRLKTAIARHVSPAVILGKPIRGIGGGDIYIGIRKRGEGL